MNKLLFLALLLVLFGSCSKETSFEAENNNAEAIVLLNQAYGADQKQQLDVYLPEGRTVQTKWLVLIHGGSWVSGDKAEFATAIDSLKKRFPDFAIANINYRLVNNGQFQFPTQERDVAAAMNWINAQTNRWNVGQQKVLIGTSAGAHLALLHGYKNDSLQQVKAIVDFFGPTDLVRLWDEGLFQQLGLTAVIGKPITEARLLYEQSSPLYFVRSTVPPTIVLQGGVDDTVKPYQSELLVDALRQNQVEFQYVFYPNEGHGWSGATLTDSFDKIEVFLSKVLR